MALSRSIDHSNFECYVFHFAGCSFKSEELKVAAPTHTNKEFL